MTPFGSRRLWFALFVAVVFLLGMGAGAGLSRLMHGGRPYGPPFGRRGPGPPPPPSPAMVAERMTRDLGLSTEQRAQIEVVLRQGAERLERFHATTGDEYGKLRRQLDADIERVLTPDQQARFRTLRPGPPRDRHPPPPLP